MSRAKPTRAALTRDRNVEAGVRAAVRELEEDIVLGVLHPRERLVEDNLLDRFGLKRHVARRVLLELEQRGLVERRKNFGAVVKSYSAQEVTDLYAVREILEANAARLIPAPVAKAKLENLIEIQSRHDVAVRKGELRKVYRANLDFHTALFALSENRVLNEAIKEYEIRTQAIRFSSIIFPDYLENARREHHAMIEALRSGDKPRLVALCRNHLKPAREAYIKTHHLRLNGAEG